MDSLTSYVIKRLLGFVATLFFVLTAIFFLFRLAPIDPVSIIVYSGFPPEAADQLRTQFGLNEPLWTQYVLFMKNFVTGNFGMSFFYKKPVFSLIFEALINTLYIMIPAMSMVLLVGYFFGTYLGWSDGTLKERFGTYGSLALRAVPHFVLGIAFLAVFSYGLGWFPSGGMKETGAAELSTLGRLTSLSFYHHLALPVMTIFLHYMGEPILLQRGNVLKEKYEDYIELMHLRGYSNARIRSHAARNAMLPLVTWITTAVSISFGGVILIEIVFAWPGIGRELVLAATRGDFPVVQAGFFLIAAVIMVTNLVVDILYAFLDPRITYGER